MKSIRIKLYILTFLFCQAIDSFSQTLDSTIIISGRIYNQTSGTFEANKTVYLTSSEELSEGEYGGVIKAYSLSNDTGYFELSLPNVSNWFSYSSKLQFAVEQCNGAFSFYPFELTHFSTDNFPGHIIVICDNPANVPNPNINIIPAPSGESGQYVAQINNAPTIDPYFYILSVNNNDLVSYFGIPPFNPVFELPGPGIYRVQLLASYLDEFQNEININESGIYLIADPNELQNVHCFNIINYIIPKNDNNFSAFMQCIAPNASPELTYTWWTGLDTISNSPAFNHSFTTPGAKEVCLTTRIQDNCEFTRCDSTFILDHAALCSAEFSVLYSSFSGLIPNNVSFYYDFPTSYPDADPDPSDTIKITVDGEPYYHAGEASLSNLYMPQPGQHTICVEHIQAMCSNTTCNEIVIPAQPSAPCVANFSFAYVENEIDKIAFYPTTFGDSFTWSFGDGNDGNTVYPQHQYLTSDTFTVCLNSMINGCNTPQTCKQVPSRQNVNCNNEFFSYVYTENRIHFRPPVGFWDPNMQASFAWNFGDGASSTEQFPTHQYETNGNYTICLEISNSELCPSGQTCQEIQLNEEFGILYGTIDSIPQNTNLSDSKVFLYELYQEELFNSLSQLGGQEFYFVLRDSSSINSNNTYRFENVPYGNYTVQFVPGTLVTDTTILPTYLTNKPSWQTSFVIPYSWNLDSMQITNHKVLRLSENLGIGGITGTVLYGIFRLMENIDLTVGNLFLIDQQNNNIVRHIRLNGLETFSMNQLDYGYYKLILDLPGYITEPVPVIIQPTAPFVNVTLNYLEFPDAPFTSIENEIQESSNPFIVFPNPTNGNLLNVNIEFKMNEVSIYSCNGVELKNFKSNPSNKQIELQNFKPGLYQLRIGAQNCRFIVSQ